MAATLSPSAEPSEQPVDPIIIATLARAVVGKEKSEADAQVSEDIVRHVDFTVRIAGTLTRGKSNPLKPGAQLCSIAVIGELLRRLGVKRDAALGHLRDIAVETLVSGSPDMAKALEDSHATLLLSVKKLQDEVIAQLPVQMRPGAIKVQATAVYQRMRVS